MNETITKFGYPDSLLKEYEHWVVLQRPAQATLGALILACKGDATRYSDIPAAAFAEMATVISDIETGLSSLFDYQKLNYLMLMMVDPHVHYHVLPRYEAVHTFEGTAFDDPGWPGPPNIGHVNEMDPTVQTALQEALKAALSP